MNKHHDTDRRARHEAKLEAARDRARAKRQETLDQSGIPLGLCQCGCGQKTRLCRSTCAQHGAVYGEPRLFLQHHRRVLFREYVVDPDTGCWNWQGKKTRAGYGLAVWDGVSTTAHRVYYKRHVGPVAAHLDVHHLCTNRGCVNPAHLEAVTKSANQTARRAVLNREQIALARAFLLAAPVHDLPA